MHTKRSVFYVAPLQLPQNKLVSNYTGLVVFEIKNPPAGG